MNRLRITCLKSIRVFLLLYRKGHWLNLPRIRADVLKAHQKKKKSFGPKKQKQPLHCMIILTTITESHVTLNTSTVL